MAEEKLSEESKKVAEALKILQKEADNTMETFSPFIAKITKASSELTGFAKDARAGLDAIKKYEMGLYSVTRTLNLTATGWRSLIVLLMLLLGLHQTTLNLN